ncbi:50S ribosomal protein L32 [candidate division WWE3 bacterium CG09_land_8_20_14_0_10_39_24]|uniref:Large ribosomal subunit protein bL32 n=2 Tax=Katanobacteria TaxID=422282 RepID=A0A2G9XED3_UNCKA|nr:MAG: 50S ribosomal protein L32 [candidate division WWE3 bacterium CG23_combo_of_CG06-09_8_20_14_all_40_14]PIS12668.1 MAG: 50S ribosomal protein L32 [candidate division WWE3 bacterium CG09_land_8_20_14_0_10_39_24]PJE50890.1 MAG: 50S ribosomal protein L32 [candidate division WWE3 bacterium CG10_big_fil_rev_8_21_14_0_10_39_14]
MPVPKKKTSTSRKNRRRKNIKLSIKAVVQCKKCKEDKLPHTICKECGF